MAQRVGRGTRIALLCHDRGTRRGWVVSSTPWPHFTPGKDPVSILQEAGWALGPLWTGEKSRPHRDSIADRPARSQTLYQLQCRLVVGILVNIGIVKVKTLLKGGYKVLPHTGDVCRPRMLSRFSDSLQAGPVRGSNPVGSRDFSHPPRPALGPTQPSLQWVPGLSRR